MAILYEDESVICDDEAISIKGYYSPFGEDRKIPYSEIHNIKLQKLSFWSGLAQIWGKGSGTIKGDRANRTYWSTFDPKRIFGGKAIAIDEGSLVKPLITPEDPDEVYRILRAKTLEQA
ncbi:hypothetical protein [Myxosarcina sp. GI1]|uniref:hypothetical protein n=1 Tax=Myxosarcina sp. GI1 TaxID=1541065 RepID=UPI000561E80C|nr:hypothetical protein [Myxosarcina sp. GI1]